MALIKRTSMRDALSDPKLLGNAIPGDSWRVWRILLIAAFGEALTDEEREIYQSFTGRQSEPGFQVDEFYGVAGRRSGKTRAAGVAAAFVGCLCRHDYLASGERATIPVMAASQVQANKAFEAVLGVLEDSPVLSKQIDTSNSEMIRLKTRVDISVRPANFRTIRGITSPLAIGDETAFWHNDETSANSDTDILNAVRPSLATSGGLLWVISSPWAKKGELWNAYKSHHGEKGDAEILVAKGASRDFNSTLPERVIKQAYSRDPFRAVAEYGGNFLDGISALLTAETVDRAIDADVIERPFDERFKYFAFTDPSGGSNDSYTLAIAHAEDGVAVVDLLAETKPPFNPETVTKDYAAICKRYGITAVTGDNYAAEWPKTAWRKNGVEYRRSTRTASEIFDNAVPLFTGDKIAIPDNPTAAKQLTALERRTSRGGKSLIGHPPGGHDDLAVSACGAALLACPVKIGKDFKLAGPLFPTANGFSTSPNGHATPRADELFVRYNAMGNRRELTREEKDQDWKEFDRREAEAAKRPPARQTYFG